MKTLFKFIAVLVLCIIFSLDTLTAQIEVHDNGKVSIGGITSRRLGGTQLFINGGMQRTVHIEHNDLTPWSCALFTRVNADDQTAYTLADKNGSSIFYVHSSGWLFIGAGSFTVSDSSIKKDILRIKSPLEKLSMLNGYTYHFKEYTPKEGVEKGLLHKPDSLTHMGIMANEVEKIAPYAVKTVMNGKKAVSYEQLIPLLIEAVNQLKKEKDSLKYEHQLLNARLNKFAEAIDTSGGVYSLKPAKISSDYILYQNAPNPWNKQTTINYDLKGTYSSAYIFVFDLSGSMKLNYTLSTNKGSIKINANELKPGLYLYSLVVDGVEQNIKKMLLTN